MRIRFKVLILLTLLCCSKEDNSSMKTTTETHFPCTNIQVQFQKNQPYQVIWRTFKIGRETHGEYKGQLWHFIDDTETWNRAFAELDSVSSIIGISKGCVVVIGKKNNESGIYELNERKEIFTISKGKYRDIAWLENGAIAAIQTLGKSEQKVVEIDYQSKQIIDYFEKGDSLFNQDYYRLYNVGSDLWATIRHKSSKPVRIVPDKSVIELPYRGRFKTSSNDPNIFQLDGETLCWQWHGNMINFFEDDTTRLYQLINSKWKTINAIPTITPGRNSWNKLQGTICIYNETPYMFNGNGIIEINGLDYNNWKEYTAETKELYHNNFSTCFATQDGELLFSSGNAVYTTKCN